MVFSALRRRWRMPALFLAGFCWWHWIDLSSPSLEAGEWIQGAGFRSASLVIPETTGQSGFQLVPSTQSGIAFTNHLADRTVAYNRVFENGSGVALGDVDGDGACDIYLCRLEGPNALYRNLGDWRFEEIAARCGVACPNQYSSGAAMADIDGDGDLDLLVNALGGGTRAFLNDGTGAFEELSQSRLVRRFGSTSMALADADGDGDLDLYVANYRTDTYKDRPSGLKVEAAMSAGNIVVTPADRFVALMARGNAVEVVELGERDFFYLNDGRGSFAPVSWTSGAFQDEEKKPLTGPPLDWGLSVLFRDLDGNGTPDLYVCNDFFYSPDRVWMNTPGTGFQAMPRTALRNMSMSSMAMDCADIDRDGDDDFIVVDMLSRSHASRQRQRPNMMKGMVQSPISDPDFRPEVARNTLFLNRGDGTYAEIAQLSGLAATEWSWSIVLMDVDLDGYPDALVSTGNTRDVQDADVLRQIDSIRDKESALARLRRFPPLTTANLVFRNQGDLTFKDMSQEWGFNFVGVSQGTALGDLDNDGDLDVVLNNLNSGAAVYRNIGTAPRIAVRLKGDAPNTRGVGARIKVTGGPVTQSEVMVCGGRYLSSDEPKRVFAAGGNVNRFQIEVLWPSGRRSGVKDARADTLYEISESATLAPLSNAPVRPVGSEAPAPTWFEDVSSRLDHHHVDQPFDDWVRQPLLSRRLSQLGPGVGWIDLNMDGWEDLIVAAGRAGRTVVFQNNRDGTFAKKEGVLASRDQCGVAGWWRSETQAVALVGSSNYEGDAIKPSTIEACRLDAGMITNLAVTLPGSVGPVLMNDVDGDGDLDLFAGGRCVPGRYPELVSSRLFRQSKGAFQFDPNAGAVFSGLGLVSGGVFSDLDGDGTAELILACEWSSLRVFRWASDKFLDITEKLGLARYAGWWNGVTAGDFNGDGQMDIVASNWGRNTKYQAVLRQPVRIYYGEFSGSGALDVLDAYTDPESGKIVPWLDFETVSKALPFIRGQVETFRAYGNASIEEMLGPRWAAALELKATTLDSMIFLNRGEHFSAHALPLEAQFAPSFGMSVADFDGDGNEDLFMAQNFFGVEPETSRYDGGRGVILRGKGDGTFQVVPGQESGIRVYGEQRGCASADFDRDGRSDLVATQNSGATKLFRNRQGKAGLRVRLDGPPENPRGIGSVIRLQFGNRQGAAREVQAGSGYWSQESVTPILGTPERPTAVWVRWPGGKESITPVVEQAREVPVAFTAAE